MKRLVILGSLAVLLAAAPAARAQTPTAYVRGILEEAMKINTDPAYEGAAKEATRKEMIHRLIAKSFDFPMMARDALGPTYSKISAGQRQEFTRIFSYLFQDSYTRLVLNFLKKENVNYKPEKVEGDKSRVDTVLMRTNESIPVDYLMHRQGGGWILYDVNVDGVSILENYRTEFGKFIRTQSFDALLKKMKAQARGTS